MYTQKLIVGEKYSIPVDPDLVRFNGVFFENEKNGKSYPANIRVMDTIKSRVHNLNDVMDFICSLRNTTTRAIQSHSRKRENVITRHFVVYLATEHLKAGRSQIGRLINRDHSTVIHMLKNKERKPWIYELYKQEMKTYL